MEVDAIYTLDGKVPLPKAVPFGLQHFGNDYCWNWYIGSAFSDM